MNLASYVGADPINFVDPLGLYRECRTYDTTHTDADGTIVVSSKIECQENGIDISSQDRLVVDYTRVLGSIRGDESFFSSFPDHVQPVKADFKVTCPGSPIESYGAAEASFNGGQPGHIHTADLEPALGPDDGLAARNGVAYMGSSAGVFRINRYGPNNYGVSLLSGGWGASESYIKGLLQRWNKFGGQMSATKAMEGKKGNGKASGCTRTTLR